MLSNKVAIVTGATKGIGAGITKLFSKNNAIVYGIGRNTDALQHLEASSPNIHGIKADVCDTAQFKDIFHSIYKEHGHIDILINNAGIMEDAILGMITTDMIERVFQTNVYSVIQLTQLASRFMKRQKSGSIINISSIIGTRGNSGQCVYSASKGAVAAFTKSAAKELAASNIRVNSIAPGTIQTDLLNSVPADKLEQRISQIMLGHVGSPEDIANAALFLASDSSSYISGQILEIDGLTIM